MAAVSEGAGRVFGQVETPPVIRARSSAEEERSERKAFSCGGQTGLILRVSRLGRVTFDHPLVSDYKLSMNAASVYICQRLTGILAAPGAGGEGWGAAAHLHKLQRSSVFCFK